MAKLSIGLVRSKIPGCLGNYSTVAERCNVTRQSLSAFFKKHPELRAEADEDRQKLCDLSESVVGVAIKDGNVKAAMWFLDSQGRDRGFGQKMQLDQNIQTDVFKDADKLVEMLRKEIKTPEQAKKMEEINGASMGLQKVDMPELSTGQQEQQE